MRFLFAAIILSIFLYLGIALGYGALGIIPGILVASSYLTFTPTKHSRSRTQTGGSRRYRSTGWFSSTHSESDQVTITETGFNTFFQIAGHISKADGRVTNSEIRQANSFMQRLSLNNDQRRVAIECFDEGKSSSFNLSRCLEKLRASTGMGTLAKELLFEAMVNLAAIDGVNNTKRTILIAYADALGIQANTAQTYINRHHQSYWQQYSSYESHREHFRNRRQQSRSESHNRSENSRQTNTQTQDLKIAYETLGVSSNDSNSTIKRAYQRKIAETHPDKFEGKDLPAFLIEAATAKASEINEAWDLVKKSRRLS